MITLITVVCFTCGRPHCATIESLTRRPNCPFCGETVRQAVVEEIVRRAA